MSRRKTLQNYFRQSFESWVAGLRPVCFLVLFAQRKKHEKRSFRKKLRGSANLKSAHRNGSFAPQQLKPFSERFEVLQTSNQRTATIKTFPKGSFEVSQTSNQHTQTTNSHKPN
jgi:hypothetical protein